MLQATKSVPMPNHDHQGMGMWMKGNSGLVYVLVTYPGLEELGNWSKVPDLWSAEETFSKHRTMIERVASEKFAERGAYDGEFQGRPILILRGMDLPFVADA